MRTRVLLTALLIVGAVSVGLTRQGRPDSVSGTITRTFSIVANTDLTGDVTCEVADGTPCFSFTVPDVELRLKGFTVTGKGNPTTGCGGTVTAGEVGVTTNGQDRVGISGPGLIQRFKETRAFDRLQQEVGSLGDRLVEELSTTAQTVVLPALIRKIKDLIGADLSDKSQSRFATSRTSDPGSGARYKPALERNPS